MRKLIAIHIMRRGLAPPLTCSGVTPSALLLHGDGKSDILLQNSASGDIAEWQMNGTSVVGGAVIASLGTSWSVRGVGDFNGDGKADIILQNTSSGSVVEWQMNGFTINAGASIGEPGTDWTVVGAGDYNGDGKSDLILRNAAGDVAGWLINGMSVTAGRIIDSPGSTGFPSRSSTSLHRVATL